MRSAKYAQYLDYATRFPNVKAVRYEDAAKGAGFLFDELSLRLPCADSAAFAAVSGHAKFGATDKGTHSDARHDWTHAEWAAVVGGLRHDLEQSLGYAYHASPPGNWTVEPAPPIMLRPPRGRRLLAIRPTH